MALGGAGDKLSKERAIDWERKKLKTFGRVKSDSRGALSDTDCRLRSDSKRYNSP